MSVLATSEPGTYRVYADFQLDGEKFKTDDRVRTVGYTLEVPR